MLAKRIIPCLDIKGGKVVKGVNFLNVNEMGDPVEFAINYNNQKADEITFLDIMASAEGRGTMLELVKKTAARVFVPLTVGGGVRSADDFKELLRAGADKVSVNSSAVTNPSLIKEATGIFGSQCVVLAIDAKRDSRGNFIVTVKGGREETPLEAIEWAVRAEQLGAGEILLNSIDADGTRAGFDIEMTGAVADAVRVPVIASGGLGKVGDFSEVFKKTKASAALGATLFHTGELTVTDVKNHLVKEGIEIRL